MFKSFRKRPATPQQEPEPPRKSPSLPQLSATGLQWPADLVDPDALRSESPEPEATDATTPGLPASPVKTSLAGPGGAVPWHKPFRAMSIGEGSREHTISRLYEREGAAAFDPRAGTESPAPTVTARPRRPVRAPPQFNLMVAGAQGTGKTTFLRLLLATSDLASKPTPELRTFLRGGKRPTSTTQTFAADLAEARFDRLALRVTDTPGLDVRPGRELVLERQLGALISGLEQRFKETMEEESKVVRPTAGRMDKHVHLLVYMLDPDSIISRRERERRAYHRQHARAQSDATVSATRHVETSESTPPLTSDSGSDSEGEGEGEEEEEEELTLAPADLRALARLSRRANVLPVIARADMLSDSRLARCKATVRAELAKAELDLGVFVATRSAKSSVEPDVGDNSVDEEIMAETASAILSEPSENGNGHATGPDSGVEDESAVVEEEEEPQQRARPVIKLRTGRRASSARPTRSRSRSRIRNGSGGERSPVRIDPSEVDSVPVARFDAARVAERDLARAVPFALVMPERARRPGNGYVGGDLKSVSGHGHPDQSVSGHSQADSSFVGTGTPENLRGVFTRAYRWGTVDVLDPAHCDFAALRVAVLSTHMKMLKTHTREVLYERFRTEKLLVRRATQKIGEKEAKRLFEDLGL